MPILWQKRQFSKNTLLSSPYCQKNVSSLKNTVLSCHFIQIFHAKPPFCQKYSDIMPFLLKTLAIMPIFSPKNVKFVKFTKILWAKKVNRMPLFPIFYKKITFLMPIFCPKNLYSQKNTMLSCPQFVKKTSILSKHHALMSFFYFKNPLLSCTRSVEKSQFCQTYTLLWSKKVNRIPLFSEFSRKNHCTQAHIWSKNVHSLKSKQLWCPYFVKKMSIL